MYRLTSLLTCGLVLTLFISTGCVFKSDADAQRLRSQERITELESDLRVAHDRNTRLGAKLTRQQKLTLDMDKEAILQKAEFDKLMKELNAMAERAGRTGPLPEELDSMLAAFAEANSELLSYDPKTGRVRLKSDVTFASGSDRIKSAVQPTLKALAQICSSELARDCRILVVGHTDDQPIVHSKASHPTNWHLSLNRALAVMGLLSKSMPEDRLAVMGFGQFKPIAENAPNQRGNPLNRRVEIYIVPRDLEVSSAGMK